MTQPQVHQPRAPRIALMGYKRNMYRQLLLTKPEELTDADADLMATLAGDPELQEMIEQEQ